MSADLNPSVVTEFMSDVDIDRGQDSASQMSLEALPAPTIRQRVLGALYVIILTIVMLLCVQSPFFAIILLGWCYSWMRVRGYRHWWNKMTQNKSAAAFNTFIDAEHRSLQINVKPHFFTRPRCRRVRAAELGWMQRLAYYVSFPVYSLFAHLRLGLQAWLNLSILLMPAALFWSFAWWGGWNNSFFKGYESYAVGPSLGVAGIFLFIIAMTYVPMAQARHAITGNWRSFWDIVLVRKIISERPVACLLLAACIVLLNLPIILMKSLPFQFSEFITDYDSLSRADILQISQTYFFWCGVYVIGVFLIVKNISMRLYANAVLRLLAKQQIQLEDLAESEQNALRLMGIEALDQSRDSHWKKVVRWPLRAACCVALLLVWFGFVAQIFVGQFLKYDGDGYGKGWVNQPLLQVPWFDYTPSHLHYEEGSELRDKFLAR